jgi:hypothetical protein
MNTTATLTSPRPLTFTAAQDDTAAVPPTQPGAGPGPGPELQSPQSSQTPQKVPRRAGLGALVSLVINFVVPLLAYYLIHPVVGSSAVAIALAGAIPVVYTLVTLAVQRRLDPLGVVSVVTFAISVLVSWACGGKALALELQDPALTGLIGVACLVSVAINRPLHPVILRLLGRGNASYTEIASRARHKTSMVTTAIIGLAFTTHAVAVAILALTQSPGTFIALQHPVGLPPIGLGLVALFFYRSRLQARQAAEAAAHDDGPTSEEQAESTS